MNHRNLMNDARHASSLSHQQNRIILLLLLGSLAVLSCGLLLVSILGHLYEPDQPIHLGGLLISAGFSVCILLLWIFTRRGWHRFGTATTLGILWITSDAMTALWSYELPDAIVLTTLTIIVGGILLDDRQSRVFSALVLLSLVFIGCAELLNLWIPNFGWNDNLLEYGGLFGLIILISLIALVSWISNREMRGALATAKLTELELAAERDSLEKKVDERTVQLREAQHAQTIQLQKFADFGRLTSGLLHDLANPVTSASVCLQQLQRHSRRSELVDQARASMLSIEHYIDAARNQLRLHGRLATFQTDTAIRQVVEMLGHRIRTSRTQVVMDLTSFELRGDTIKFQQLLANLITNAIDAYIDESEQIREVVIRTRRLRQGLQLQVIDYGKGIEPHQLPHVFEPFFSTKMESAGMGLGLMLARQTVEQEFDGTIEAKSTPGRETVFSAFLQHKR